MATKFLEPGGDATSNVATPATGGFWRTVTGTPAASVVTDFVHGTHVNSIRIPPSVSAGAVLDTPVGTNADAGGRMSVYVYFAAFPSASVSFMRVFVTSSSGVSIHITSGGVLQLFKGATVGQIGSNGSTLSTGTWYRITLAYTFTSTVVNEVRVYVNGVLDISTTNVALTAVGVNRCAFDNVSGDTSIDFRLSDVYVDDSTALTDPGNIWVTAKRPNANGTTNGFSTQIGAGGSGYGTGHSPQVNERPLSTTNGWSMVGAGNAVTEEYNIENKSTGDINVSTATIVDWIGWLDTNSLVGETVSVILDGATVSQAITSSTTLYTKVKGSTTYPSGTGADIGMITDTSLTTVKLYECGVMVAFIPGANTTHNLTLLGIGT